MNTVNDWHNWVTAGQLNALNKHIQYSQQPHTTGQLNTVNTEQINTFDYWKQKDN